MVESIWEDARYAVRNLRRDPFLALAATLTLAVCIGASTTVFSLANSILIRPLPYPASERIDWIGERRGLGQLDFGVAAPDYFELRKQNRIFEDVAAYSPTTVNWTGIERPEQLDAANVSPPFFGVMGTQPLLGRYLAAEEQGPQAPPVVVLSYEFWRNRMGGDPHILGKTIAIDRLPHTIIGVMPQGFDFPRGSQLWLPATNLDEATESFPISPNKPIWIVLMIGRRKPGVTPVLKALIADVSRLGVHSIAVPPLGCGLGGLDWREVRPMIEQAFSELPDVRVLLFEPTGTPDAKAMPVRTARPHLTPARALFIKLMDAYAALEYSRTLLEVQKLAYFLQEAGEPLRLKYEAGHYGPYATNLNKVLELMEGHFIRGYGDSQKPQAEIELLPGSVEQATDFLAGKSESLNRLERVSQLIEGFETPYGMELLATVHWVAHRGGPKSDAPASAPDAAIEQIHAWNPRKQQVFKPEHIRTAWIHLGEHGWMQA